MTLQSGLTWVMCVYKDRADLVDSFSSVQTFCLINLRLEWMILWVGSTADSRESEEVSKVKSYWCRKFKVVA